MGSGMWGQPRYLGQGAGGWQRPGHGTRSTVRGELEEGKEGMAS
jgi:hypothetical protein